CQCRKETTQTTCISDRSSNSTHRLRKVLMDQLEDCAISKANHRRYAKSAYCERHHVVDCEEQRKTGKRWKDPEQDSGSPHTVRQPPAQGTHCGCKQHKACGPQTRVLWRELEYLCQKDR